MSTYVDTLMLVWLVMFVLGAALEAIQPRRQQTATLYASVFYHQAFVELGTAAMQLVTDTVRMMLLIATASTPDSPDHTVVDNIDGDEDSGGGYARVTLTGKALTDDDANNRAEWDFNDVVFPTLSGSTIIMAAAYKQTGGSDATPADDPLIALWDIANTAPDGSDFTLQVGSEGAVHFA